MVYFTIIPDFFWLSDFSLCCFSGSHCSCPCPATFISFCHIFPASLHCLYFITHICSG